MELTKEGLDLIETSRFAETVHDYLSPQREDRATDSDLPNLVTGIVAWVATGHDISRPPVDRQSYELTAFVLGHLKEVTDLRDIVTKNMLKFQLRS
ncbi:MAG TPA: hypothetical protein VEJ67_10935 [Candidatus Cybelea sp.]|nr:hypothetical protein [Candidatus Cybelea sp.]